MFLPASVFRSIVCDLELVNEDKARELPGAQKGRSATHDQQLICRLRRLACNVLRRDAALKARPPLVEHLLAMRL